MRKDPKERFSETAGGKVTFAYRSVALAWLFR